MPSWLTSCSWSPQDWQEIVALYEKDNSYLGEEGSPGLRSPTPIVRSLNFQETQTWRERPGCRRWPGGSNFQCWEVGNRQTPGPTQQVWGSSPHWALVRWSVGPVPSAPPPSIVAEDAGITLGPYQAPERVIEGLIVVWVCFQIV